jgi:hypothetical protein
LLFLSSHLLLVGDLGPALSRFELARRYQLAKVIEVQDFAILVQRHPIMMFIFVER